jgi:hypothetical protein
VLGVIYVPCSTSSPPRVYYAVEGCGAFVRSVESRPDVDSSETDSTETFTKPNLSIITPTRLEAEAFYESDGNLRILAHMPSFGADSMKAFLGSYASPDISSGGGFSLLSLMAIAEGKAHVLPRLASSCEWDTCAAHAIINEAGGEVLQVAGGAIAWKGAQLEYNKPHPLNPHFIAYGKRLILSPVASPSVSQMLGVRDGGNLEGVSEGSEGDGEGEVVDDPEQLFQSVEYSVSKKSSKKTSPRVTKSADHLIQQRLVGDADVRRANESGVHTSSVINSGKTLKEDESDYDDEEDDEDNGSSRSRSGLYGNMLFSFLVATFVVLVGWVSLPSPLPPIE